MANAVCERLLRFMAFGLDDAFGAKYCPLISSQYSFHQSSSSHVSSGNGVITLPRFSAPPEEIYLGKQAAGIRFLRHWNIGKTLQHSRLRDLVFAKVTVTEMSGNVLLIFVTS